MTYGDLSFTWEKGRRLSQIIDGENTYSYTYNADGIRTSKTVNGVKIDYVLEGDRIVYQKYSTGEEIWYNYDAAGKLLGFHRRTAEGLTGNYYYIRNGQGDILGFHNQSGRVVVRYTYDAWGKVISITGSMAGTLGKMNPFRYRGYYYDEETELYYLNSRYYSPEWGRFLNADAALGSIGQLQSHNMFSYAFNNPTTLDDPTGNWPKLSTILTVVAVTALAVAAVATIVATCGAATPALALAGGGMIGGLSAATATTIATGAMIVAGTSAVAAIAASAAEKSHQKKLQSNHTVYKLIDNKGTIQYIGRTTNVQARKEAHKRNPFRKDLRFDVVASDLNYYEARGLEQIAMLACHTINATNRMNNQINGISPSNPRLLMYMEAGRAVAGYLDNQISNEILYWTGN